MSINFPCRKDLLAVYLGQMIDELGLTADWPEAEVMFVIQTFLEDLEGLAGCELEALDSGEAGH